MRELELVVFTLTAAFRGRSGLGFRFIESSCVLWTQDPAMLDSHQVLVKSVE